MNAPHIRMLIGTLTLTVACLRTAVADPAAPSGWMADQQDLMTVYSTTTTSAKVEFRLHAAEVPRVVLNAWFLQRMRTPPAGVVVDAFGEAKQTDTSAYTSVQKGTRRADGAGVIVMDMGCQTRGGAYRYGELILPPDMAVINAAAASAASIIGHACVETQTAKAAPVTTTVTAATSAPLAPGAGLKPQQLEAILFSWEQVYRVTGLQLEQDAYLVLKDGSYRTTVPQAALEDFDIAADRHAHANYWGRWRKDGDKYLLAELGAKTFHTPQHQSIKLPARASETLSGIWSAASGGSIGTTGYWSRTSVSLTSDGRFTRNSSGGAGGGSTPSADFNVQVLTVHDDEGSASAVGSSNFGGGGTIRNGQTIANRSGTYKLNGYTIELRYDDGRVVRQIFFADADRHNIWFAGAEMRKEGK